MMLDKNSKLPGMGASYYLSFSFLPFLRGSAAAASAGSATGPPSPPPYKKTINMSLLCFNIKLKKCETIHIHLGVYVPRKTLLWPPHRPRVFISLYTTRVGKQKYSDLHLKLVS